MPRPMRSAMFEFRVQNMIAGQPVGEPSLHKGTFIDYGNGTLETPSGAAFRMVNGRYLKDGSFLFPGAGFVYGKYDQYDGTITKQLTPWEDMF